MRRSARGEQSAFSLFPFLAVLLCTMGAMVVLLVAIAHVARTKAEREAKLAAVAAEQARKEADSPKRREAEAALEKAERFAQQLKELTEKGAERLQQEQERLSAMEDHLRRLRDDAERLKTETMELFAVEQEHYDDEKIAREEIKRLNKLIGEIEDEIEQAKYAATGRERRFAVVPLRDKATGTIRPPVYFECTGEGVTLQPEGIRLGWEDLVAAKFSSPMAAASRAVTRYYEENPEARAANEAGPPYALLIVRPDGISSYYGARRALETVGASYGYQPVGDDWPIEYDPPNPVLMQWVEEAVETARNERQGLAKVIPQLAQQLNMAKLGPPSARGSSRSKYASAGQGGGLRVSRANPEAANPFEGMRIDGSLPGSGGTGSPASQTMTGRGPQAGPSLMAASTPRENPTDGSQSRGEGGPIGGLASSAESGATSEPSQEPTNDRYAESDGTPSSEGGQPDASETVSRPQSDTEAKQSTQANGSASGGSADGDQSAAVSAVATAGSPNNADRRGRSGSASGAGAQSRDGLPMVRPIRLYVTADRVVVLPDRAQAPTVEAVTDNRSQSIPLAGPTTGSINEVIAALKRHADAWGIAGSGMYWDPRLVLNVAGDGADRAAELTTLLEAAGLKVQAKPVATAAYPSTNGGTGATR